ncbi:unnamed protein product [Durusdinium trenchii]|uniref:Uncharacterized protein n=1 Tax=Durusdinium trenchii TaxID=1381693 RepID=A0ABP0LEE8_9DINO
MRDAFQVACLARLPTASLPGRKMRTDHGRVDGGTALGMLREAIVGVYSGGSDHFLVFPAHTWACDTGLGCENCSGVYSFVVNLVLEIHVDEKAEKQSHKSP